MNELITNALKYGFLPGETGNLTISLTAGSDNQTVLTVANDGDRLPANFDLHSSSSMGLQLVLILVEQLEGTIVLARGNQTFFKVTFPVSDSLEMVEP